MFSSPVKFPDAVSSSFVESLYVMSSLGVELSDAMPLSCVEFSECQVAWTSQPNIRYRLPSVQVRPEKTEVECARACRKSSTCVIYQIVRVRLEPSGDILCLISDDFDNSSRTFDTRVTSYTFSETNCKNRGKCHIGVRSIEVNSKGVSSI